MTKTDHFINIVREQLIAQGADRGLLLAYRCLIEAEYLEVNEARGLLQVQSRERTDEGAH
jgi:hypothetical protein